HHGHCCAVPRHHVLRIATSGYGIQEPPVEVAVLPERCGVVLIALARRMGGREVESRTDGCSTYLSQFAHGFSVRQEQVVSAQKRFRQILMPGSEEPRLVSQESLAPRLVVGEPYVDAISQALADNAGVACESVARQWVEPSALHRGW